MAVESPTNCWTETQANLMAACANSARFQQIINANDATAAAAKIFGQQIGDPDTGRVYTKEELLNLGGHAQVYSAPDNPFGWRNQGDGFLRNFGTAIIYIDRLVTEKAKNDEESPLEMERWMENRVGDALTQIHTYLEANTGPRIKTALITEGPGTNDRDEWSQIGIWQGVEITLEWGYD